MTASMPDLDKAAGVIAGLLHEAGDHPIIATNLAREVVKALSDAGLLLPDGFVAVPREPTEAMIEAGNNALVSWVAPAMHSAHAYRAMIQAQEKQG